MVKPKLQFAVTPKKLPLAGPGIIAGVLLTFIPMCGDYVTATVLGGAKGNMIGAMIASQFSGAQNWPLGSAMAILMIGAGTSHGVQPVGAELSPFHFNKSRLDLLEPSHMHTSMAFLPSDVKSPRVGDSVGVQQPLTRVYPDILSWL